MGRVASAVKLMRPATLILTLSLLLLPTFSWGAGDWFGGTSTERLPRASGDRFICRDSGGSGGAFGRGDIRHNIMSAAFAGGGRVYLASGGGVFASTDGGWHFRRLLPSGAWRTICTAANGGDRLYLTESVHAKPIARLYMSDDGGATWRESGRGVFNALMDFAAAPSGLYAMCWSYGVKVSEDNGETWRGLSLPGGTLFAGRVEVPDPDCVLLFGSQGGKAVMVRRADDAKTWMRLPIADWNTQIIYASSFPDRNHGWVGGSKGQIFRTQDGGDTWCAVPLPKGETRTLTALSFENATHGFAAVRNSCDIALYETTTGGDSWCAVLDGQKQLNALYFRGGKLFAVGTVPGNTANDLIINER